MKYILLILFGLGFSMAAQDLKVLYRKAEGDISKVYLVGVNPKAKIAGQACDGGQPCRRPQVLLLLPKPSNAREPIELKNVLVCPSKDPGSKCPSLQGLDGKPFRQPFIEVSTTRDAEEALAAYPGDLDEGRRFEAILTLKNLWVDDMPTTQTVPIPSTLNLRFEEGESIYEDGIVTFRVVYVPNGYEEELGKKDFWDVKGIRGDIVLEGVSAFNAESRALKFYLPKMVRQPESALAFGPKEKRVKEIEKSKLEAEVQKLTAQRVDDKKMKEMEATSKKRIDALTQQSYRYVRRTLLGGAAPGITPGGRLGRTRPFKTNGPVISQDLPIFIRGAYTNNRGQKTGQHVFNLEASFAADNDFALPPVWQTALNQLIFTPHVKLDMNTARTLDNPNSIVWSMPLTFRHYMPGTYSTGTPAYRAPRFRFISLQTGLKGEHSLYKQSQNVLIPLDGAMRYATRPGDWRFSFDAKVGGEVGQTFSETIDKMVLEDPKTAVVPATFSRTLTLDNRRIRRVTGEAKFSLTQGKKVSLEGMWQFKRLLRKEQIIKEREVAGKFSPDPTEAFFELPSVRDTYKVLETSFSDGVRRYGEVSFKYAITETISADLTYKRGYKAPTFQAVNMVSVGFSYSLGKPKE